MPFQTINPATGKLIKTFTSFDTVAIDEKISLAQKAFLSWKKTDFKKRALLLHKVADNLELNATSFANIINLEMGKPLSEGEAEVKKCALACRYFADHAEEFLKAKDIATDASHSYVRYDPLGVLLAVMPWNFPFWQVFRVLAPALMAGNVVLLKHAGNTPQCSLMLEKIISDAGFPEGALVSLFVEHDDIEHIISDQRVKAVSLTGSTKAGSIVASLAGKLLKPCVLELGGSDPFIVFDDADIKQAALIGASARLLNSGQSCINAKRFFIHQKKFNKFIADFMVHMKSYELGPLATHQQREIVHAQVTDALSKGAHSLCGAHIPMGEGYFYPATILTNIKSTMQVWHEEVFGPVALVFAFDSDDEVLKHANDTVYGLGAAIWTHDKNRIERFSSELECGSVFVNHMVKSDPKLPFGGIKQSGFGRELSLEGIRSFVNIKTIFHK